MILRALAILLLLAAPALAQHRGVAAGIPMGPYSGTSDGGQCTPTNWITFVGHAPDLLTVYPAGGAGNSNGGGSWEGFDSTTNWHAVNCKLSGFNQPLNMTVAMLVQDNYTNYLTFADCAQGSAGYDGNGQSSIATHYGNFASYFASVGYPKVYFRIGWEFNGDWATEGVANPFNTALLGGSGTHGAAFIELSGGAITIASMTLGQATSGGIDYLVGDTLNPSGGTYSAQGVLTVTDVHLDPQSAAAGSMSGYVKNDKITLTAVGSGVVTNTAAVIEVTSVSAGAVTGYAMTESGTNQGDFSGATPTSFTQASTTGSGTGFQITSPRMGIQKVSITTAGSYTVRPGAGDWMKCFQVIAAALRAGWTSGGGPSGGAQIVWNPAIGFNTTLYTAWYPGDSYVDVVGLDFYDNGSVYGDIAATPQKRWSDFVSGSGGLNAHAAYGTATVSTQCNPSGSQLCTYSNDAGGDQSTVTVDVGAAKALAFPEWGMMYPINGCYSDATGDDPYFVDESLQWVASNNFAYYSPFDSNIAPCGQKMVSRLNLMQGGSMFILDSNP